MELNITAKDIFGDFVIDVNKVSLEEIKNCEAISLGYTTAMFYEEILSSQFVQTCVESKLKNNKIKLVEPKSIKDYCDNFAVVANVLREFGDYIDKYRNKQVKQYFGVDGENAAHIYAIIDKELTMAATFFEAALEIMDLNNQDNSKKEYLKAVLMLNKKAASAIKQIRKLTRKEDGWVVGLEDGFKRIQDAFVLVVGQFDEKKLKETSGIDQDEIDKNLSQREKERLQTIAKANDLYGYFVIDFLRDVEAQTPYTARHMLKKLNEKHEKFKNCFDMPLSSDASIGKANECINQINAMIDYVSKISESSYVVSGYSL